MKICRLKLTNIDRQENDDYVIEKIIRNDYNKVIYITTPQNQKKILKKIRKKSMVEGIIIDSFFNVDDVADLKEFINQSIPYEEDIFIDVNIFRNSVCVLELFSMIHKINIENERLKVKVLLEL